jgi:hypothetical protein
MREQGKTDSVKIIRLPSTIQEVDWLLPEVAAGGEVGLEVRTQFVADGSPIKIRVFRVSGKQWAEFDGKVYGDLHRRKLVIPLDMDEDILFQADLNEHDKALNSSPLRVLSALRIAQMRWLDEEGKDCGRIPDGAYVQGKARIEGHVLEGDPVAVRILLLDGNEVRVQAKETCFLKGGWVSLAFVLDYGERADGIGPWPERARTERSYVQPSLVLEASCRGVVARGVALPLQQKMVLWYADATGGSSSEAGHYEGKTVHVRAPDGTEKEYSIPSDGKVTVDATQPGRYLVEDPVLDDSSP